MTAKFRVGFTITGETLMALAAKAFHSEFSIEELSIEALPTIPNRLNIAPKRFGGPRGPQKSGPKLDAGANRIILEILADKEPHTGAEMKKPFKANGFSMNSVGSRLDKLRAHGVIERVGDGTWRLVNRREA